MAELRPQPPLTTHDHGPWPTTRTRLTPHDRRPTPDGRQPTTDERRPTTAHDTRPTLVGVVGCGSSVVGRRSSVVGRESWVVGGRRSSVVDEVVGRRSSVVGRGRGSWVVGCGSWVMGRGSWSWVLVGRGSWRPRSPRPLRPRQPLRVIWVVGLGSWVVAQRCGSEQRLASVALLTGGSRAEAPREQLSLSPLPGTP